MPSREESGNEGWLPLSLVLQIYGLSVTEMSYKRSCHFLPSFFTVTLCYCASPSPDRLIHSMWLLCLTKSSIAAALPRCTKTTLSTTFITIHVLYITLVSAQLKVFILNQFQHNSHLPYCAIFWTTHVLHFIMLVSNDDV